MSHKSISDLERYRKFIIDIINEKENQCKSNIFSIETIDIINNYNEVLENIKAMRQIITIIDNEIQIAFLSNSITFQEEEYSIYQATKLLDSIKNEKKFYQEIEKLINDIRSDVSFIQYVDLISISPIVIKDQLDKLNVDIYNLNDKIERKKSKTIIEIDMSNLIPDIISKIVKS
ncbi:MAG: hypothetical protein ACOCV1_03985 [Bacillota bacterium]